MMQVNRLLKSWAMPAARGPRLSYFWASRNCSSSFLRSVRSIANSIHVAMFASARRRNFASLRRRASSARRTRSGFTAYFATAGLLFRELEMARAEGSYAKSLRGLGQVDALIVDDWAMSPLADTNAGRSWKSATRDT
jgi:hypothetical protein